MFGPVEACATTDSGVDSDGEVRLPENEPRRNYSNPLTVGQQAMFEDRLSTMNQQTSNHAPAGPAFERHYSVQEVASMWSLGVDAIRKIFENESDVVRIGHEEFLHKRKYVTLRIPESVLRRVHRRLTEPIGKPV